MEQSLAGPLQRMTEDPPPPSDTSEEDRVSLEEGVGGFIRSLSKSVPTLIRTLRSKRVRPRTVASTADRFSTMMEVHSHFGSAEPDAPERGRSRMTALLRALPAFLKSSVLGAVVFEAYAFGAVSFATEGLTHALSSAVLGALCGTLHGSLFVAWDAIERRGRRLLSPLASVPLGKYSVRGVLASHTAVHGTLFGSYELIKSKLMSRDPDKSFTMERIAAIAGAGMVSACLSEWLNYYTAGLERYGLNRGYRRIKYLPPPKFRAIVPGSIPTALGLLAYEYSKPHH